MLEPQSLKTKPKNINFCPYTQVRYATLSRIHAMTACAESAASPRIRLDQAATIQHYPNLA